VFADKTDLFIGFSKDCIGSLDVGYKIAEYI